MRDVSFVQDEWYHCFNRGVEKRTIFHTNKDYDRFLMLLYICNSVIPIHISNVRKGNQGPTLVEILEIDREETLVDIAAYALMPNHFHLLLREKIQGGITSFIRKVCTGYAMYYNIKRERTGTLFQGKFKSRHVADDFYFNRLLNYIHANPAELYEPGWKKGIFANEETLRRQIEEYRFSSLPEYLNRNRSESVIIAKHEALKFLQTVPTLENIFVEARIFAHEQDIYE